MLKTLSLMLALALLTGCACAQETPATETDPGIPADFNDYLRKVIPGLDPGGKHDLFALKDPKDKNERHDYTVAMTQLVLEYMITLDMGSTVAKVFDQYSRGKEGNQVTFKVLHAIVLLHYPPGKPNTSEAEKLLRQAAEDAPDYAFPWFLLAQYFEYPRLAQMPDTSPRDTLAALDKALEIRPKFLRAVLLKSQVYLQAKPPRYAEVKEMIAPFLDTIPPVLDDFEDLVMLFAASHTEAETAAKLKAMLEGGKLSDAQKVRCLRVQAHGQLAFNQFDAAITSLEDMLKLIKTADSPADAIWAYKRLGACWGSKAMRLRQADPELAEPGARESFDTWSENARVKHGESAEIERKYLPLALRGTEARQYVEFLVQVGNLERALEWLTSYLDETDLAAAQRNVLRNLQIAIKLQLDPTEEGLLDMYESQVASDNMGALAEALERAVRNMKLNGEHFKTERALTFFSSQLDNRLRLTVGFAAILSADTALQIGTDSIARTGEAIAARLEKETELNSDEQAKLQAALCDALALLGHRPSQERGVRHVATLIDGSTADSIRTMMTGILNVWNSDEFLAGLKAPPAAPGPMEKFNPAKAAAWLKKLADALKQE